MIPEKIKIVTVKAKIYPNMKLIVSLGPQRGKKTPIFHLFQQKEQ